ncbi:LuxR C-terminal-related transcriptional regulator [Gymnodinialimonas sp. 57CJ19]|uniref:helix-turn-helix transcriptional regulator n=1 Tax=Gymnodinialimonas sp. 57CJ19 TaxID=3138498 RepID=UPI0031344C2F
MLDFQTSTLAIHPGLIDTIYRTTVDEGDLDAALQAIAETIGARAVRLIRAGRGEDVVLGSVGPSMDECAEMRRRRTDGSVLTDGRRLVLSTTTSTASDTASPELLQSLLCHLDRAVALANRLSSADMERNIGSDLLERLSVGTVFLDAERNVVTMTGMASTLIAAGDGLRLRGGMISALCGTEDRALQSAIKATLSHPENGPSDVLRVHQPRCERALGIVVQPIAKSAQSGGIACALVIRDSERTCAPGEAMLRKLFDLTPAEATLTSILSMGLTLDEASAELDISRNTARAHLRAIFSKCGINRQTELVRLVLTSVAMLGKGVETRRAA